MSRVRGWCPTAWRPMAAGDGLLVRVRPPLGCMTAAQAVALADAARAYGNGQIDCTNRGGLQLRGVQADGWPRLVAALAAAGLVDAQEGPPVSVAPDWRAGDATHRIATLLHARRALFPPLPPKVGIAVDAGPAPVLRDTPADFRIERAADGGLLLRADGRATGVAVRAAAAVDALLALTRWFLDSGGGAAGRMARHMAPLPAWAAGGLYPMPPAAPARPGPHGPGPHGPGVAIGLPFGRIDADGLARLVAGGAHALRMTPWRMLIAEGRVAAPAVDPALLAVDACVGAPACPHASVETRALATRLAPHVAGLHVSGCAKGCARARPAAVVLTGRDGRFDLARHARAGDPPHRAGLDPASLPARFGAA